MALIKLNRTKTGTPPTALEDGELYIDQFNSAVWWKDAAGRLKSGPLGGMPPGTRMLFQQSAAPTGWTKETVHNDKALRVVSGAASLGGTAGFSSVFRSTGAVTGETVLTVDQIPAHRHVLTDPGHAHNLKAFTRAIDGNGDDGDKSVKADQVATAGFVDTAVTGITMADAGGGKGHTHSLTIDLLYLDVIIAVKD